MGNEQALQIVYEFLKVMVARKASDLFLADDFPPSMKVHGKMTPLTANKLTGEHTRTFAYALMNEYQRSEFEATQECNFAIAPEGIGRFRVNIMVQQNQITLVLRTITTQIPTLEELRLPEILKDVVMTKRGLVILVGATGSGKSTTLAAMINHRNEHSHGHIITIEDPVEYVHKSKSCLVTHREVGRDTKDWMPALKNTLRQAPDVILIGEIRDRETMEFALAFAETGHLCMATLHANSANQALDRIINFFPEERRNQLLMDLSLNMKAFISQRLIPSLEGGRAAAIEILLNSPLIAELILKGEIHSIKEVMGKSRELGMQTFDQALYDLQVAGKISMEEALRNADSINELRLRFKLSGQMDKPQSRVLALEEKVEEDEAPA